MRNALGNFWFWNIDKLLYSFYEKKGVNEFLYGFFAYIFICALPLFASKKDSELLILVGEQIIGYLIIYWIHRKNSDNEFIKKIVCLTVPITFRLIALSIVISLLFYIFLGLSNIKNHYDIVAPHLFNILGFTLLGKYIYQDTKRRE